MIEALKPTITPPDGGRERGKVCLANLLGHQPMSLA